jgi:hypothetical protein
MHFSIDGIESEGVVNNPIVRHGDAAGVVGMVDCGDDITMTREIFGEKRILCAPSCPPMVE